MTSASSETVPSLTYKTTASCHLKPRVSLKTSITHPINVSWIVPEELISGLSMEPLPETIDLFDIYTNDSLYQYYYYEPAERLVQNPQHSRPTNYGNLALSSCPGKKVRLNGPVRGRASIDRDLDLDFQRLKSLDISVIICCLTDEELAFLGASWPKYCEFAQRHDLQIIRIPMIEGGCPESIDQMDQVIIQIEHHIKQGRNILAHCRGADFVHSQTFHDFLPFRQVDFIMQYANYIHWQFQQSSTNHITHQAH
ncbi:7074_t:CDS:2 [Diversispora eburnea]|uniref:7074_t:CDS:1 n=1 Tax=Diversispora eburnea TaxID=1213867 RepID=A0A9N8YHT3_9GLOM|nr:7074_t:CDS:2 [Diversispora eburnea]